MRNAELVFDRVLDRENLLATRANEIDRGVERGGLPRARRTRGEHDPMRLHDRRFESSERILGHPKVVQSDPALIRVQQPEHHALAMQCRNGRHTYIDRTILKS